MLDPTGESLNRRTRTVGEQLEQRRRLRKLMFPPFQVFRHSRVVHALAFKGRIVGVLDRQCREQQTAEGWFPSWEEVPQRALTLTIPTLFRVPKLIVSVPGKRKAEAVRRTLYDPITTGWPSTLLRTHPDVTIYLDTDSAAELKGVSLRS